VSENKQLRAFEKESSQTLQVVEYVSEVLVLGASDEQPEPPAEGGPHLPLPKAA